MSPAIGHAAWRRQGQASSKPPWHPGRTRESSVLWQPCFHVPDSCQRSAGECWRRAKSGKQGLGGIRQRCCCTALPHKHIKGSSQQPLGRSEWSVGRAWHHATATGRPGLAILAVWPGPPAALQHTLVGPPAALIARACAPRPCLQQRHAGLYYTPLTLVWLACTTSTVPVGTDIMRAGHHSLSSRLYLLSLIMRLL